VEVIRFAFFPLTNSIAMLNIIFEH